MLIAFSVPASNERGPQYMEQLLSVIHQANTTGRVFDLLMSHHGKSVTLFCRFPTELRDIIAIQLAAHYPDGTISVLPESAEHSGPGQHTWSRDVALRPDIFPIRCYREFEDTLNRSASDPLTALFAAIASVGDEGLHPNITFRLRPVPLRRVEAARTVLRRLGTPFLRRYAGMSRRYAMLATSPRASTRLAGHLLAMLLRLRRHRESSGSSGMQQRSLGAAEDKLARHLFDVRIRMSVSAPAARSHRARECLQRLAGALGQFTVPQVAAFRSTRVRRIGPRLRRGSLLSCEELATLWHPATMTVRAPAMHITQSRELEPPVTLPTVRAERDLAALGRLKFRDRRDIVGIRPDDRRRHIAVIGKTGMGKTTLLQNLIDSDIAAGRGLTLIDPHGDLVEAVLRSIPSHRTNDVILFDAGDREYPLAFNPLAHRSPDQRGLVASGVVSAFKKLYGDSWGPRLEHIFRNSLLALLEIPGTSLLSLQRLLGDAHYRKAIIDRLNDPVIRVFWQQEFASWKPQYQAEAIAPIQNKVGQFLSLPIVRAIVGQARTSLDLRHVMDEGRVLLVNLSKGRIGEDASTLLGSLLVTGTQLAAMGRAEVPEEERHDFSLFVDEFQNFATDSFATILSEARKYRLSLTVANQYLAQMEEATAAAVFGNVGSLLVFQVGASDAEALAEQLGPDVVPQDLLALPRFTAYARLLIDGSPSRPFSVETLPPPRHRKDVARQEVIRRTSRHRYCREAGRVEAETRAAFAHIA